ncbi:hypothetical protein [Streptomyces sp. NBC_01618]|uniref:hypothetical protein n=1 Tax=Streptomyces sp. NBC_01618 TaxID=2975900 RepID=UPI00386378F2|nr:hypothetical protein OH735_22890 [Streptomyces sp. NBC_01618]
MARTTLRLSGGKSEYLMGQNSGLVASVSAGRIIVTRMTAETREGARSVPGHGRTDAAAPGSGC